MPVSCRLPLCLPHSRSAFPTAVLLLATWLAAGGAPPARATLGTELVATGLQMPVFLTSPPGDSERLFVVEQRGRVRIIENGTLLPVPFLDIDPLVPDITGADERGLVGLAFHPDYATNGYFYVVYYSVQDKSVLERYTVSADPNLADPASAAVIFEIDQPHEWHNANTVAFGPDDGYLYLGLGDGGPSGDPNNRAQNGSLFFGKILRLDVDGGFPYAIPPDNPYIGNSFNLDEIWAKGLRNPYRFTFDRLTNDLYIGDVGQDDWEEISFEPGDSPGAVNYGWRRMEGTHCFIPQTGCNSQGLLTLPVHEYSHGGNPFRCSVTAGAVYRGTQLPELAGHFLFADFCSGQIWSFRMDGQNVTQFTERTAQLAPGGGLDIAWISAIAADAAGELYIIDREDGEVFAIIDPTASGVAGATPAAPVAQLRLLPAQPNPFSAATTFGIDLPRAARLEVTVYDASGRQVRALRSAAATTAGRHALAWDGRDASGRLLPAGIYFIRAAADGLATTQRLVIVR